MLTLPKARRALATVAATAGVVALVLGTATTASALMTVTAIDRVSLTDADAEATNYSQSSSPGTSADGRYVVFLSNATDLVAGDTNGETDVFVRDTVAGTTVRVNVGPGGVEADDDNENPAISADGRWVSFNSRATNLLGPGVDLNGVSDVFVHDLTTGTTSLVSVPSGGGQANDNSRRSAISADGRYIAFDSVASNLVAGATNVGDVFLRDTVAGTTVRVSESTSGAQGDSESLNPSISADGAYVVFMSYATTLLDGGGDTNGTPDVFRHAVASGTTIRVSVATGGVQSAGASDASFAAVSANGNLVTFHSDVADLVASDTNGTFDVFVRDVTADTTVRVSRATDGTQGNGGSSSAAISSDGTVVVFESSATNLGAGDANGASDVFHHVLATGETTLVSSIGGVAGNGQSSSAALSHDGSYVVFSSDATDLVAADGNGEQDVLRAFLEDVPVSGGGTGSGAVLPPTGAEAATSAIGAGAGAALLALGGGLLLRARRPRDDAA